MLRFTSLDLWGTTLGRWHQKEGLLQVNKLVKGLPSCFSCQVKILQRSCFVKGHGEKYKQQVLSCYLLIGKSANLHGFPIFILQFSLFHDVIHHLRNMIKHSSVLQVAYGQLCLLLLGTESQGYRGGDAQDPGAVVFRGPLDSRSLRASRT